MAECAYCQIETQLNKDGIGVCVKCAEARDGLLNDNRKPTSELKVREILHREVLETTAIVNAASEEFNALLDAIPSGVPYPDGTQRIHLASHNLSVARKDMITAHSRLNDFLSRGIIPEELKYEETKRSAGDYST